jgi:hypothetical protein
MEVPKTEEAAVPSGLLSSFDDSFATLPFPRDSGLIIQPRHLNTEHFNTT